MSKFVEFDGFARDENGKIHIRPLKIVGQMTLAASLSGNKNQEKPKRSVIRRNLLPIEPLHFDPSEFEEPQQTKKKPRLEKPVRKELFKVPHDKQVKRLSSYGSNRLSNRGRLSRTSTCSRTNLESKKVNVPVKKQIACNDGSPLFDVEEADQFLSKKNSFIPVKTVLFPPLASISEESNTTQVTNSKILPPHHTNTLVPPAKSNPANRSPRTPSSVESELEFLAFEKGFASAKKSAKKGNAPSPLTSVCSLLAKTNIASPSIKQPTQKLCLSDILDLVKENKKEIQALRQTFDSALANQESKLDQIIECLEQKYENKENVNKNRRSIRIATQQSTKANIVSPAMSKKEDLRKKTLNKNFSKNLTVESPRTKKAVDYYNSFRNDLTVLCTPKLDRSNNDMPQNSVMRSLSQKVQNQCFLLQDTPRPKTSQI